MYSNELPWNTSLLNKGRCKAVLPAHEVGGNDYAGRCELDEHTDWLEHALNRGAQLCRFNVLPQNVVKYRYEQAKPRPKGCTCTSHSTASGVPTAHDADCKFYDPAAPV